MLTMILLRHGKTSGNAENRFNGRTDDPLSEEGILEAERAPHNTAVLRVYASPLQRAQATARIFFPNAEIQTVDGLREMDFGDFENRSPEEMADDPVYLDWIARGGTDACPNGESVESFAKRASAAFAAAAEDALARGEETVGVAVHGGVIMAVMSAFSGRDVPYHDWYVKNCSGYRISLDERLWTEKKRFSDYRLFGELETANKWSTREP